MELLEYFEKNNHIKNKKIDLVFDSFYIKKLYEIIENELEQLKQKIKNTNNEMDSIYSKRNFEQKEKLSIILTKIDESILKQKNSFCITYENLEILNIAVCQRIVSLNEQRKKWGRTLNKEIDKEYNIALRIQSMYISEYDRIIKKLYSKREQIDNLFKDYIEESQYNNFLINNNSVFHLHISMREKESLLEKLNSILDRINNGIIKDISSNGDDELTIKINKNDVKKVFLKIIHELEKNINSGSIIPITIKEYFVLNITLEAIEE